LAAALALAAQGLEPARVARGVFALLTLQDTAESVPLNAPLWSMLQEFRLALIYPALYLSLRRAPAPVLLVCCGVATLAMLLPAGEIADQFYRTAVCTACFAVGAVFAIHRNALAAFAGRIPGPAWLVLLVLLWPLSCNSEAPIRLSLKWAIYLSAMAAVPIALYQPRIASLLSTRVPQYLGLISYSLYLVHQPMLDFAYPMLGRILAPAMALPLTLGLTFAVAILLFRIVEAPARHWSHARLMTPRASLDLGEVRP
jgi:peptidoglycan/LPS O-acetylase OafA/YrhL